MLCRCDFCCIQHHDCIKFGVTTVCKSCSETINHISSLPSNNDTDDIFKSMIFLIELELKKLRIISKHCKDIDSKAISLLSGHVADLKLSALDVNSELSNYANKLVSEIKVLCSVLV